MADAPPRSFLGTGWAFPPTFSRQNATVVMSSDVANIKQCLWVLFSTNMGERTMLATYGTGLRLKVFDSLTETLANDIRSLIEKAILDWEPRIDVLRVDVDEVDPLNGQLAISVDFIVRQTNARSNLVYPFYLTEATLAPPAL
ncbi:MAG TPA: GPW/gp25 family protein [Allosphingosinicella sp.]|nr:GPW/gp25 family protein [Allosphingosinicella sp.]